MDLPEKMEEIAWRHVQEETPGWAKGYLTKFRALPEGPQIFVREGFLHRELEAQIATLQYEGLIPDFSALKAEALAVLNSDGE